MVSLRKAHLFLNVVLFADGICAIEIIIILQEKKMGEVVVKPSKYSKD